MIKKIDPNLPVESLTFDSFFKEYHRVTRIDPVDKALCRRLFEKTLSMDRKRAAYRDIKQNSGPVYQYLKTKLCNY